MVGDAAGVCARARDDMCLGEVWNGSSGEVWVFSSFGRVMLEAFRMLTRSVLVKSRVLLCVARFFSKAC